MAPKSKAKQTPAKAEDKDTPPVFESSRIPLAFQNENRLKSMLLAAATLVTTAFSSPLSQMNLHPVYGSIPSYLFHQQALVMTCLAAFIGRPGLERYLPSNIREWIPVFAYYIPVIQFVMFKYSSTLGPFNGPLLTEALTCYPLILLGVYSASKMLGNVNRAGQHPILAEMLPAVGPYLLFSFSEKVSTLALPRFIGRNEFLTRSGLQLLVASLHAALAPSKLILLAVPAMLHTYMANPHYVSDRTTAVLNNTLSAYNFTLLERHESVTGYISVLETVNTQGRIRVMRCDHSLLGGEWLVTPAGRAHGMTQNEPIYQVFTMLEAVRLVKTANTRPDSEKSALVIGLGIGTAPKGLIAHNINTTIVELDPMVHYFAQKYFALPATHTAAIQNALTFVDEVAIHAPGSYDYILHDVFTGGAEPAALFTVEFLAGLHTLLREDGVVAINYAGDLNLHTTQMVLHTIHSVFPTCRLFRDNPPDPERVHGEFVNMVVFCTKSSSPLTFRRPKESDFMGSISRQRFLPPPENLEIRYEEIIAKGQADGEEKEGGKVSARKVLKKGQESELEKHHDRSAVDHWRIMRTVLPDAVWENW